MPSKASKVLGTSVLKGVQHLSIISATIMEADVGGGVVDTFRWVEPRSVTVGKMVKHRVSEDLGFIISLMILYGIVPAFTRHGS